MLRASRLFLLAILGTALAGTVYAELIPREHGLQATLQEATTAFEQSDYARAAAAFEHLAATYADEPRYRQLEPRLLPLHAHASRMSGDAPRAITLFESYLEQYPDREETWPFVLFSLAQAYQENGNTAEAARAYQRFRELAPDRPEALVSVLREADLSFTDGDSETGIARLLDFAESPRVPATLRSQARLRAVQAAQSFGRDAQAADILLGTHWAIRTMPDLAILAFAGLRAGEWLANEGRHAEATLAYRTVPPYVQLLSLQRERLAQLLRIQRERLQGSPLGVQADTFWRDYFAGVIAGVREELATLEAMEDYTPGWQLRLGETFLRGGRPREAALLFRHVSENEYNPAALRERAHYAWILSANDLEDWDRARAIAEAFLEAYPQNPLAPEALFLIANAYQQEGKHTEAVEVLDRLLAAQPGHKLAPRWRFARGYNHAMAENYTAARDDFTAIVRDSPDDPVVTRARLWQALTHLFEKAYADALVLLEQLKADAHDHPLAAEIAYRRASALYAMRDYATTRDALVQLLADFPDDQRAPAARVLLGDALMGLGELDEAAAQFDRVTPAAASLYPYAVFQRGKIHRATGDIPQLIAHFEAYTKGETQPPRVAEALTWIGWGYLQLGETDKAYPHFTEAFDRYGNDPHAGETGGILRSLEQLQRRNGDDFIAWLERERTRSLENKELTRYARLTLYLADSHEREGRVERADTLRFAVLERVPPEALDAAGLAAIGQLLLADDFPSARRYFEAMLEAYPQSPHTGAAYYGLALLADDDTEAETWLKRFQDETPYHAEAIPVALLRGEVLLRLGKPEQARRVLEETLTWKHARGQPQAKALLLIADSYAAENAPDKAIAYQQHVYTLYRAYPDLLARAYWQSAQAFLALERPEAARRTLIEMTGDERLTSSPEYPQAVGLLETLSARQPETEATP